MGLSFKTLGILDGISRGLNDAADTFSNLKTDRIRLDREKQTFDTDMKIKNLELEKLEGQMDPELYKIQSEALKSEAKVKKASYDHTLLLLESAGKQNKDKATALGAYGEGIKTSEINNNSLMNVGGMQIDINAGLKGGSPYKAVTPANQLKNVEARKRLAKEQKLTTDLPKQPLSNIKKKKFWGGDTPDKATQSVASEINSYQDLINLIENQDALADNGVNVDKLLDYYNDELLELAMKGFIGQD